MMQFLCHFFETQFMDWSQSINQVGMANDFQSLFSDMRRIIMVLVDHGFVFHTKIYGRLEMTSEKGGKNSTGCWEDLDPSPKFRSGPRSCIHFFCVVTKRAIKTQSVTGMSMVLSKWTITIPHV